MSLKMAVLAPFPLQLYTGRAIRWVAATYTAIHHVLTNPVYAGAYTYGKTRRERYVDADGMVKKQRSRRVPITDWAVLLRDHHPGFIDWMTFEANQVRIDANVHPQPHQAGGAVREGTALLQGLAVCGHCGRRLRTHYRGRHSTPGYHCAGKDIVRGRGVYCLNVGGAAIDQVVATAFLEAVTPAALDATLLTVQQLQTHQDAALAQWRLSWLNGRATTPSAPSAAIGWSNRNIDWSRAAWKPNGRPGCATSPPRKRN